MPFYQKTSSTNLNAVNIFHIWYTELCRRINNSPSPIIKTASKKCQTILDFTGDRLKFDEWNPVINALRHDNSLHVIKIKSRINNCQFLYDIDTENKLRVMKRRYGILWTDFVLKSLLKSVSCMMKSTQVLTYLELDGLPLFKQYLEMLMKALQTNKTLKILSLARCPINDIGCQIVCNYLRFTPNIEILNLTRCGLTSESGEFLAKLIKYQQINRYCETWHNSLRYSDPNIYLMGGLKRITLNRNPDFGDHGLELILDELIDDLWIKALDLQNCCITDGVAVKILEVVEFNQSLEILDLRLNDQLDITVMQRILHMLKEKQIDKQPEFQWCNTTATLTCNTLYDAMSNCTTTTLRKNSIHKTKSVPIKLTNNTNCKSNNLRKTKSVPNKTKQQETEDLQARLQDEINRRMEIERANQELMKKLNEIIKVGKFQATNNNNNNLMPLVDLCSKSVLQHNDKKAAITYKNGYKEPSTILKKLVNNLDDNDDSDIESLLNYVQNENKVK